MATVVKDFKIKSGLVVEGTTGTINTYDILTKKQADQDYIVGLIGGTSTAENTPDTVVKRDGSGNFAAGTITANLTGDVTGDVTGNVTGDLTGDVTGNVTGDVTGDLTGDVTGNADTATALQNARTIAGQTFDGTQNVEIAPTDLTGVTATATELNILDGATVSTTELNYVTGVTSAIQDQLDGLASDISDINADTGLTDHANATSGVHGVTGDVVGTTDAQTLSNKTLGTDLAAGGYKVTDLATPTSDNDAATKKYVDDEVAALVNGAPELLDTLNELAAAIGDDRNYATTVSGLIAGKQDLLSAGNGIVIDGDDIIYIPTSIGSGISVTPSEVSLDRTTVDTWYDAAGSADDVQDNLDTHTNASSAHGVSGNIVGTSDSQTLTNKTIDGGSNTISNIDNTSLVNYSIEINGYETNLGSSVTLDTDDISEGSNRLYHTDTRAKAAAAALLTSATLDNITITGDETGLTITAENGVADSTTDDLEEGEDNLYFLDSRAVDALEAVVPNFTAVEFNSVAKQVAAEASVATASTNNALTWAKADYRSAEFLVKIKQGNHTEVSKLVLTMDASDNIAITEYAMVGTNGDLGSYSATVSGTDVALTVTTLNNNSDVMVVGTLLK